jgi:hypothetical protein
LLHFFVALRTQRRRKHCHRGVSLRPGQIAHSQTGASDSPRRQIRPALALRVVFEIKYDFVTLGIIKRGEELFCRINNFSRRVVGRCTPIGKGVKGEPAAEGDEQRNQNQFLNHNRLVDGWLSVEAYPCACERVNGRGRL